MKELYADAFYRLSVDAHRIFHLVRSDVGAQDLDQFVGVLEAIESAVEAELTRDAEVRGVLIDSRAVRPRNDRAFEDRTRPYRQKIQEAFPKAAVLVRSEIGKLHIARLSRDDGTQTATFTDLDEAMGYLLENDAR